MNVSIVELSKNGTELLGNSSSDEDFHSKDERLPHVFDLFTVRLILGVLYSLVFITCVLGKLNKSMRNAHFSAHFVCFKLLL